MALQALGKPATQSQIAEMLLRHTGYETESENVENKLRTAMTRKPKVFWKVSRTHWGLQEWRDDPDTSANAESDPEQPIDEDDEFPLSDFE